MEQYKFKIGDSVSADHSNKTVTKGKIIAIATSGAFLIESEEHINGHHGGSSHVEGKNGKNGYCWYFRDNQIKLIKKANIGSKLFIF